MAGPAVLARWYRFGPFELDVRAGELRKHGIRIKLREQPVQVLLMLLAHPGEVVLREEIRRRLWPNNTMVEFDHGINAAVQKLRDALGESAGSPRYVETVARRGYRFLGEVEREDELRADEPEAAPPAEDLAQHAADSGDFTGALPAHYRILGKLGEGGMGTVFRVADTKLHREVALKVVAPDFAADPTWRARFEREAHILASLNHPNVVAIHDFGGQDGALYLVTELVAGESLRKRIERGHIGMRELINIAVQITDGTSAAHQVGIVHRDLKPENIMVTPDGRVRILDFGLARQTAGGPVDTTGALSTAPGVVMGTVNYMSPEQARGLEATHRGDQFSFGVILYELASGARPFERETSAQTLTAVLVEEAKPLDAKIPAPLRWTIGRCLAKDPNARYESTRDLYQELRNQQEHLPDLLASSPTESVAAPRGFRGKWTYLAMLTAGLAAGALVMLLLTPKHNSIAKYHYTPMEISHELPTLPRWSPDGKAFAYSALVDGKRQAFVRFLSSPGPAQLTHGASNYGPIGWSSDGKRIYIVGNNPSGTARPLALASLSVTGGEPEFVMPLPGLAVLRQVEAQVSPDGKMLAILRDESDGTVAIEISSPVGSPFRRYAPAPYEREGHNNIPQFRISPDGSQILYFLDGGVNRSEEAWRLPLPPGKESPKQILKDLPHLGGTPIFSWFPDNRRVVISLQEGERGAEHLWTLDSVSGRREPLTTGIFNETYSAVSPNGKQVLFVEDVEDHRVVSASLEDASPRTVIESQRLAGMPQWAAKGERFVYVTEAHGEPEIWMRESDGGERAIVTPDAFPHGTTVIFRNPALSPAGDRIAYERHSTAGADFIWISSLSGGPPVRLSEGAGPERMGAWSPDGGRMVFSLRFPGSVYRSVMIAKTSGQAPAVKLVEPAIPVLIDWSPTGEWITFADDTGWKLVSPDGKRRRDLGNIATQHLTFSRDGKTIYGIREDAGHQYLFSLPLATGQMKTTGEIPADFAPGSRSVPGIRFSVAQDGKSLLYPTFSVKTSLWMLEGFEK